MRRRFLGALVLVAACSTPDPAPAPPPPPPTPPPTPSVEVHGLRASTPRVEQPGIGNLVEVDWLLEWSAPLRFEQVGTSLVFRVENAWLLRPCEMVTVAFFAPDGRALDTRGAWVAFPDCFCNRSEPRLQTTLSVSAPANAAFVSVVLGRSGLDTPRAAIR